MFNIGYPQSKWGFEQSLPGLQIEKSTNTSTLRSHTSLASGFGWPNVTSHATGGAWKRWKKLIVPFIPSAVDLGILMHLSRIVAAKLCRCVILWKDSISDVFASRVILKTCPRKPAFSRQPTIVKIDDFWLKFDQHQIQIVHKTQKNTCFFSTREKEPWRNPSQVIHSRWC